MYRIAVCDDSPADRDFIINLLDLWKNERNEKINIEAFPSAESFLFKYAEDKAYDILLLDIEMGNMDGVSLAKALRKDGCDIEVAFITGYPDFISEGYEVNALHYLMKPVEKDKLFAVLDKAAANLNKKEKSIIIPVEKESVKIPLSHIQYAEVFSHSIKIVTLKENYEVKLPLYELEKTLGESFVKCHRSYLVGLRHISKISKTEVILDSGKALPLSRNSVQNVSKAFISYYKEN